MFLIFSFSFKFSKINHRLLNPYKSCNLEALLFVWIVRDQEGYKWFADLLADVCRNSGMRDLIDVRIYMTRLAKDTSSTPLLLLESSTRAGEDALTGLHFRTQLGYPQWSRVFGDWRRKLRKNHGTSRRDIGVFYCGPMALGEEIADAGLAHSVHGTKFIFKPEYF